ncbi:MAG: acyl-CoA dehydrogenase family protein [Nanoarchaeota archaeon]|nr:acyl-CoA dehydrogenase family protein [Nanoarchaeota archaeon]
MNFYAKGQKDIINQLYGSEYDDILEGSADFIEKEIAPTAEKIDKEKLSPEKNLERLAMQGMLASHFSEDYGSLALPYPVHIAILEMVSKACASTGVSMAIHNTCCEGLKLYGTEKQKKEYLTYLIGKGDVAAFCLTESGGGTNIFHDMKIVAKKDKSNYVINGSKTFITNAGLASVYIVFAKLNNKVTMFLVDKDTKGLEFGNPFDKDCVRGSVTCEVFFDDCKVPKKNLLGKEGGGARYCIDMLNKGRVGIATLAVGIAQAALEKSLYYVTTRNVKGTPIGDLQLIQKKIASMSCNVDAARLLTYHAASLEGESFSRLANEAKLFASRTALECALESKFIHAAHGCMTESNIERHLRDVWVTLIGEGTSEILEQTIARLKIKEYKNSPGLSFW